MITLLYFAWLRERIGTGQEQLALPGGVNQVGSLIDWLADRGDGYRAAFAQRNVIRCAVNQSFGSAATAVGPDDEIAFFPPITGG